MEGNKQAKVHLFPLPPYNFHISVSIFQNGDPQVRMYKEGVFYEAIDINNNPVLIKVKSVGTVNEPVIELKIVSDGNLDENTCNDVKTLVSQILSLDDNLAHFYENLNSDPVMAPLFEKLYGLKFPMTPTVFEALIDSIIEQQISLSVARQLQYRLIKRTGRILKLNESDYYCYPSPQTLAKTPISLFRDCGLTTRKSEYIIEISKKIVNNEFDIEKFRTYKDINRIIDEMCRIRGIGLWTAELTILRGIHRMEAFPAADIALKRMISNRFFQGKKISSNEVMEIGKRLGNWRGFAVAYLEFAEFLNIP